MQFSRVWRRRRRRRKLQKRCFSKQPLKNCGSHFPHTTVIDYWETTETFMAAELTESSEFTALQHIVAEVCLSRPKRSWMLFSRTLIIWAK
jgi:hypothetical protein